MPKPISQITARERIAAHRARAAAARTGVAVSEIVRVASEVGLPLSASEDALVAAMSAAVMPDRMTADEPWNAVWSLLEHWAEIAVLVDAVFVDVRDTHRLFHLLVRAVVHDDADALRLLRTIDPEKLWPHTDKIDYPG